MSPPLVLDTRGRRSHTPARSMPMFAAHLKNHRGPSATKSCFTVDDYFAANAKLVCGLQWFSAFLGYKLAKFANKFYRPMDLKNQPKRSC